MDESLFLSMDKGLLSAIPAAYSGGYIFARVFHCYLAATRYTGILIWRARNMENITIRMLRLPDVMAITGLSRAAIYAKCNPKDKARYDPDFPQRVQLSANTVAWPWLVSGNPLAYRRSQTPARQPAAASNRHKHRKR